MSLVTTLGRCVAAFSRNPLLKLVCDPVLLMWHVLMTGRSRVLPVLLLAFSTSIPAAENGDLKNAMRAGDEAVRKKSAEIGELPNPGPSDSTVETARAALSGSTSFLGSIDFGTSQQFSFPSLDQPATPKEALRAVNADVVVFISLSMSESHLKRLFVDAVAEDSGRNVTFVLRGWHPPDIQGTLKKLQRLYPVVGDVSSLPNVVIDPTKFRSEGIDRVPVALVRNSRGVWKRVIGEAELSYIVQVTESDGSSKHAGVTHEIEEPDVLSIMQERALAYDFSADVERAKKRMFRQRFPAQLPITTDDQRYLFDPSIKTSKDILDHEGKVVVAAGTMANALDHIAWRRQYVFLDASIEWQVQRSITWAENKQTTFFLQNAPEDLEGMRELRERLGGPVYPINPYLVERLGVQAVPSLVEQAGNKLQITTMGESSND